MSSVVLASSLGIDILVPIGVCVVLPVMIVWLVMRSRQNEMDKKTEIMLKAIESGAAVDKDFFKTEESRQKSLKEKLLGKLTGACVTSLIGVALIIFGFLSANGESLCNSIHFFLPLPVIGGILLAVGISLFVVYFVGKKMLSKEIEAEEKSLKQ